MKRLFLLLALFWVACHVVAQDGIIKKKSANSVGATLDKLESVVAQKGFKILARIDHAAGAAKSGHDLLPTELLIFGNPAVGTQLMLSKRGVALDLPMKVLAWEEADGSVWISFNEPQFLVDRHQIEDKAAVVSKMTKALNAFTDLATR